MTPDNKDDTCEGAAGCAYGSQTCKGTMPALAPNPIKAVRKARVRISSGNGYAECRKASKENEPASRKNTRNVRKMKAVPTCVMIK